MQLFRDEAHPRLTGDVTTREHFEVEILDDDGTWPLKARFTFDRSLDDPSLVFLAWDGRTFVRYGWEPIGVVDTVTTGPWPDLGI